MFEDGGTEQKRGDRGEDVEIIFGSNEEATVRGMETKRGEIEMVWIFVEEGQRRKLCIW